MRSVWVLVTFPALDVRNSINSGVQESLITKNQCVTLVVSSNFWSLWTLGRFLKTKLTRLHTETVIIKDFRKVHEDYTPVEILSIRI